MFETHTLAPLDPAHAPERARPLLDGAKQKMGMVPNLYRVFAHAPAALEAYLNLAKVYDTTSFSPVERQVVLLAVSYENSCDYCMAAHSMIATLAKTSPAVIEALREGAEVPEAKLDALAEFARAAVRKRGFVDPSELEAFYAAGYGEAQVLEVILGIALKTMSNYTNHVAETPLDPAFSKFAWQPQAKSDAA